MLNLVAHTVTAELQRSKKKELVFWTQNIQKWSNFRLESILCFKGSLTTDNRTWICTNRKGLLTVATDYTLHGRVSSTDSGRSLLSTHPRHFSGPRRRLPWVLDSHAKLQNYVLILRTSGVLTPLHLHGVMFTKKDELCDTVGLRHCLTAFCVVWAITRREVVWNRRFGTTCPSYLQG